MHGAGLTARLSPAGLAASDTPTTAYGELLFAPRPAQSSGMGAAIAEWPYHSTAV